MSATKYANGPHFRLKYKFVEKIFLIREVTIYRRFAVESRYRCLRYDIDTMQRTRSHYIWAVWSSGASRCFWALQMRLYAWLQMVRCSVIVYTWALPAFNRIKSKNSRRA